MPKVVGSDLKHSETLDFADLDLTYDAFRELAQNASLDNHGRIGFPTSYRDGYESAILRDIAAKLPVLTEAEGKLVVDIGPGCANLPRMIIDICVQRGHRIVLVDSEEMLSHLPDVQGTTVKCAGQFPNNFDDLCRVVGPGADALICYSVLHYMYVESNVFDVIEGAIGLLAPSGAALFGDIPNVSKRRRFFASSTGKAFHRAFTGKDEDPPLDGYGPSIGKIDDAVLMGLVRRAQASGCDGYVLPQPAGLPMANRRDDLLIVRP